MSHLLTAPGTLAAAATDVDGIAMAIQTANAAAAGRTSGLMAAADDEVSAAVTKLFNAYGDEYQFVVKQAQLFQAEFTQALSNAAAAYAQAEAFNGDLLNGVQSLLSGQVPTGSAGALAAETALIMGGTGNPIPGTDYLNDVYERFIQPLYGQPITLKGITTPEQFWPVTPNLGNLTFAQSVAKGVTALTIAVNHSPGTNVIFGYSQSATIVNNYINSLIAAGAPRTGDLSFVMIGAPNNPDGGLLARFPGFYIPFLDVPFNGATPPNSPYPTNIYTLQYDGIANAPRYPLNILADVNAVMGYFYVHGNYPTLTSAELANSVILPTSPGYTGNTTYHMILTQNLPLLQPIRNIPYAGPPLADLIQPQLRVLVDLGYSDYSPGTNYANIPTPAGLLNIPNPFNVAYYLAKGTLQAPYGAAVDIGVEAGLIGPEYYPNSYPWVPSTSPGLNFFLGQQEVTALSTITGQLGNMLHGLQ